MQDWQPTASLSTLKARATFIQTIRQFFIERQVLEVDTPALSLGTVTDLHLDPFVCPFDYDPSGTKQNLYLQTSPEFAMKRLLAAGSGPIFQICKAFRHESAGRFHNPEFTILEWYRTGFNDHDLMQELDQLQQQLLGTSSALKISYHNAFLEHLQFDPLTISLDALQAKVAEISDDDWLKSESKDTLLQWLFSTQIEPVLGQDNGHFTPCFVYDFPASQASLARVSENDPRVAHRFELYYRGVELANGFYELDNAAEQRRRFEDDNQLRKADNKPQRPIDERFIAALEQGLPDCAGVAVGIDRLFMLAQSSCHIEEVLAFPVDRA